MNLWGFLLINSTALLSAPVPFASFLPSRGTVASVAARVLPTGTSLPIQLGTADLEHVNEEESIWSSITRLQELRDGAFISVSEGDGGRKRGRF